MNATDQPPIVLLHGWGGSFNATWANNGWLSEIASRGRCVIEVDIPGHGITRASNDPGDYADLAGMLRKKIPEGTIVDAIGYSLGAKLLLALAMRDPDRYRRLVVAGLGANAFAPEPQGEAVAAALENGTNETTPPPVKVLVDYALSAGNDPQALAAVLRRMPNPVITPIQLAQVTQPTLLIAGDRDAIAMPIKPLLDALPHATCQLLSGVDHLNLPANLDFRGAALAFLN